MTTIAWIMQVSLADYIDAPKDHPKKFKRAIKSFLSMEDKYSKLIIVNDGCSLAHNIYFKEFAKNEQIQYVFLEKTTPFQNSEYKGELLTSYQRVGPRQLGRYCHNQQLTTYLDSDGVLMPDAANIIRSAWEAADSSDISWLINQRWYDNLELKDYLDNPNYHDKPFLFDKYKVYKDSIKIKGLKGKWLQVGLDAGVNIILNDVHNIVHKSNMSVKWQDSVLGIKGGIKPSALFVKRMMAEANGALIKKPYYVRCRYKTLWDY
tara:strand:- start:1572 stop:2360 length:789 start_codon:yes stop_codon:yes gene_type:complete